LVLKIIMHVLVHQIIMQCGKNDNKKYLCEFYSLVSQGSSKKILHRLHNLEI
jgi:hypothetical protein